MCNHLEHVVEQVELDDRLALDEVVHHGGVDVAHDVGADADDEALQQVDLLSREKKSPVKGSH